MVEELVVHGMAVLALLLLLRQWTGWPRWGRPSSACGGCKSCRARADVQPGAEAATMASTRLGNADSSAMVTGQAISLPLYVANGGKNPPSQPPQGADAVALAPAVLGKVGAPVLPTSLPSSEPAAQVLAARLHSATQDAAAVLAQASKTLATTAIPAPAADLVVTGPSAAVGEAGVAVAKAGVAADAADGGLRLASSATSEVPPSPAATPTIPATSAVAVPGRPGGVSIPLVVLPTGKMPRLAVSTTRSDALATAVSGAAPLVERVSTHSTGLPMTSLLPTQSVGGPGGLSVSHSQSVMVQVRIVFSGPATDTASGSVAMGDSDAEISDEADDDHPFGVAGLNLDDSDEIDGDHDDSDDNDGGLGSDSAVDAEEEDDEASQHGAEGVKSHGESGDGVLASDLQASLAELLSLGPGMGTTGGTEVGEQFDADGDAGTADHGHESDGRLPQEGEQPPVTGLGLDDQAGMLSSSAEVLELPGQPVPLEPQMPGSEPDSVTPSGDDQPTSSQESPDTRSKRGHDESDIGLP